MTAAVARPNLAAVVASVAEPVAMSLAASEASAPLIPCHSHWDGPSALEHSHPVLCYFDLPYTAQVDDEDENDEKTKWLPRRPGMILQDVFSEEFPVYMCIYFGGSDGYVAEHFLHGS